MKYLKQIAIILAVTFLGELLHAAIPLNIPASIYGIVLLFTGLETGIVKLSAVRETGTFLVEIMSVMFLPAAAGVLEVWDVLKDRVLIYAVILVVTTVLVMAASGLATQMVSRHMDSKGEGHE